MPEKSESELEFIKKEKEWWIGGKRKDIYDQMTLGKSLIDIAQGLEATPVSVQRIVSHPFFLKKLEHYLSRVFFNFQVSKILALDEGFKLLWDAAVGRKQIEGLTKGQTFKYFISMLSLKEQEPKVINPRQYNLIMNILKADSPEQLKDLAKEFGFEGLEISKGEGPVSPVSQEFEKHEEPKTHPQLDKGEEAEDE